MKNTHSLHLIALASVSVLLAGPALAQDNYSYIGLSGGQSRAKLNEQGLASGLVGAGQTASLTGSDSKDRGYKLFGGYQLNRYLGFELGYFNLGKFDFDASTVPAGTLHGKMKVQGINADLVGQLPITDRLSALARVGVNYARTRDRFTTTGAATVANARISDKDANYKVGFGLQYAMADWMQMRLEAERYRLSDAVGGKFNANLYSVGLVFPFGRTAKPVRQAAYTPAPPAPAPVVVEAPPAPAPVAVIAVPAPAPVPLPQRVSFSAESMFTFDRDEIRPEGKAKLDVFVRELQGTRFDTVTVEGHTDRLGTPAYNQDLSQRRADAVKNYLVSQGQLDPAKINTVAKGETMPVTQPEDCKGVSETAKLVACLQPDRRVEIEVNGTRR